MPLIAYNLTTSPLALAAGGVTLPASVTAGARGPAYNVNSELRPDLTADPNAGHAGGLSAANFAALQVQVAAGSCELAWTSRAEYLTATLAALQHMPTTTVGNLTLYVDPTLGSDVNPGTAAAPLKTIAEAHKRIPPSVLHEVSILLADGDYNEPLRSPQCMLQGGGSYRLVGNLARVTAEAQRTADITSASTIGNAGAGWGVNALQGYWVKIVSGTGSGQVKKIRSNTTDTITINSTFSPVPNNTSVYEIQEPKARILGTIAADPYASSAVLFNVGGSELAQPFMSGLSFPNGIATFGSGVWGACACSFGKGINVLCSATFGTAFYVLNGAFASSSIGVFAGESATSQVAVYAADCSLFKLYSSTVVGKVSIIGVTQTALYKTYIRDGTATHGIAVGRCTDVDWNYVDIYGTTNMTFDRCASGYFRGDVSSCSSGAIIVSASTFRLSNVTGTSNTGTAVVVKNAGRVFVEGTVTITGSTGELKSGNRAVETWAGLATCPSQDDAAQCFRATIPGSVAYTVALGRALKGVSGSGVTRVVNVTDAAVMTEVAGAPNSGEFQVNYSTGLVTFHADQASKVVDLFYSPVAYQGTLVAPYVA